MSIKNDKYHPILELAMKLDERDENNIKKVGWTTSNPSSIRTSILCRLLNV